MDDPLKDVIVVVSAVGVSVVMTCLLWWAFSDLPRYRRDRQAHFIGGSVAFVVVVLVIMAAAVALMGNDLTRLDGEPVARMAFVLTGAVGLVVALLVSRRLVFWPNAVIIGVYALTLSAGVLVLAATMLMPPIQPLFPPR